MEDDRSMVVGWHVPSSFLSHSNASEITAVALVSLPLIVGPVGSLVTVEGNKAASGGHVDFDDSRIEYLAGQERSKENG